MLLMELAEQTVTPPKTSPSPGMYTLLAVSYLYSLVLKGRRSENVVMVVLGQVLQEVPHLLLSFEGSHFGSYRHRLFLIYMNQNIGC